MDAKHFPSPCLNDNFPEMYKKLGEMGIVLEEPQQHEDWGTFEPMEVTKYPVWWGVIERKLCIGRILKKKEEHVMFIVNEEKMPVAYFLCEQNEIYSGNVISWNEEKKLFDNLPLRLQHLISFPVPELLYYYDEDNKTYERKMTGQKFWAGRFIHKAAKLESKSKKYFSESGLYSTEQNEKAKKKILGLHREMQAIGSEQPGWNLYCELRSVIPEHKNIFSLPHEVNSVDEPMLEDDEILKYTVERIHYVQTTLLPQSEDKEQADDKNIRKKLAFFACIMNRVSKFVRFEDPDWELFHSEHEEFLKKYPEPADQQNALVERHGVINEANQAKYVTIRSEKDKVEHSIRNIRKEYDALRGDYDTALAKLKSEGIKNLSDNCKLIIGAYESLERFFEQHPSLKGKAGYEIPHVDL